MAEAASKASLPKDRATNAEVFRAYVEKVLLPTLRPGDIVVMDNLGTHRNKQTLALIEAAGAEVLLLPPCSPDLNPIEMMWSKLKAILRKIEPRDPDEIVEAVAHVLSRITPQNVLGWFSHFGYNFI